MPLELEIIRASEFVRLSAKGHLDFAASKQALHDLAHACRKRGLNRALLDLRELPPPPEPRFTPAELAALVETFREAGFTRRQRLAVLYRTDPHSGVRTFAFIGRMRGWHVRAFDDFELALLWLSEVQETRLVREEQSTPIKIAPLRTGRKSTVNRPGGEESN